MLDSLRQDLRFAVRSLRRRPVFLLVPVLSLAIGIGANTTIFTAVKSLLLSDPPGVANASRIAEVGRSRDGRGFDTFSYPDFLDLRAEAEPFQELAGYEMQILTLSRGDAGDRVMGMLVSANYFEILGVQPAMGRTFLPEEDEGPDEHPVAVISHAYWKNRLGGDPDIVGSTLYVSRKPYTVVGVAPHDFHGHVAMISPDVYVPLMQHPSLNEGQDWFGARNASWFQVLGLLKPGRSAQQADAAVGTVFQRLAEAYPETNARRSASARAYGSLPAAVRGPVGLFLGVLMAFVGLILLVTCANVAGMFMARGSRRRREIAIRLSVGSGKGRIMRHLLTESMLVFIMGGAGGVLLSFWALRVIAAWDLPAPIPINLQLTPDLPVALFAIGITLATGLIFGLLPARQALSLDLLSSLKGEGASPRSQGGRLRRIFVGAEIGGSLVLLVAAGLFLQSLRAAGRIETGFEAREAFISLVDLAQEGYASSEGAAFQDEILEYFRGQPWVQGVALAQDLPLDMASHGTSVVPEGWEARTGRDDMGTEFSSVSVDYFQTLKIPLLEGRTFSQQDRPGGEPVAVVSRAFADQAWPGESALGRYVSWGGEEGDRLTVVGVVGDTQNQFLTDIPGPFLYRPLAQSYSAEGYLVIRSMVDQATVGRAIQEGLRTLDPRISLSPVIALGRYTDVSILPQRIAGVLSSVLGFLALLLSGMGVYGVMAFMVSTRRREIGIRSALGAEPRTVLASFLSRAFRMAVPGLVVGGGLAVGLGLLLRSLLLGVDPLDPLALVGMTAVVVAMIVAGTLVPARRAARVDPAEALRYD